jgi:hypothetical protein
MSNTEAEALAFIQASRRRDFTAMDAIWHRSPNPAYLTGQCIGVLLDVAQIIATQPAAADGPALVGRILEEAASPTPQPVPEPPAAPGPVVVDIDSPEAVAAAKAALLAAFDLDLDGLNAVLCTLTYAEVAVAAAALARMFVAFVHEDDRAGAREQLARSMRSGPPTP